MSYYQEEYRNKVLDGILEEFKTLNSTLRELVNAVEPKESKEEPEEHHQNQEYQYTEPLNKGDYVILNDSFKAIFLSDSRDGYVLLRDPNGQGHYRAPRSTVRKVSLAEWDSFAEGYM